MRSAEGVLNPLAERFSLVLKEHDGKVAKKFMKECIFYGKTMKILLQNKGIRDTIYTNQVKICVPNAKTAEPRVPRHTIGCVFIHIVITQGGMSDGAE